MLSLIKKVFGSKNKRELNRLWPLVEEVNAHEKTLESLSDDQIKAKTDEFRKRIQEGGETVDDLLVEAYAVCKQACRRMVGSTISVTGSDIVWDMVPYDVQVLGGIALHNGGIAEMQTGEGKTLVAVMPMYLNALTGRNCQLVTVNDYLARRDSEWVGAVLRWLGCTVGCIQNNMRPAERREQYACDVTYGTNSEFGFDYLRDMGMATEREALVQRDYYFAIIDEIDSILIDEARTPLIISGPVAVSTQRYDKLKGDVELLFRKQMHFCSKLVNEAKAVLTNVDAEDHERDEALGKLVLVKLGMPKHKQFMRLLEDPTIKRLVDRRELDMHSQQNRGLLEAEKDKLYFSIDEKAHDASLSEMGRKTLRPDNPEAFVLPDLATQFAELENDESLSAEDKLDQRSTLQEHFDVQSETIHNISQLLKAYCLFEKDVQYVVQNNKVIIVDQNTGRPMPGRRFSDGLHQALEAKEDVEIERETQTMATVTIQNYFRMYDKLAGMTGTAETEAAEFKDIYELNVVVVPTNRPCVREDNNDRIFKTRREKYKAIIEEVKEVHAQGRPILLGTVSVDVSEVLSRMLRREKIVHNVLNAKNHEFEADIVSRAGQRGAVTIATNMAGRGTDIRLGEGVHALGGLHVIGSARHDSRRIDRQLRGRCARQGDPGSSRFYISLEDDLMRLFGSDRISRLMEKLGFEEGEELSHPVLNKSLENAQRRVEQQHFSVRKRVLQFDDVKNKQREVVYGRRKEVLFTEDSRTLLFEYVDTAMFERLNALRYERPVDGQHFDVEGMLGWLRNHFPIGFTAEDLSTGTDGESFDAEALQDLLIKKIVDAYKIKVKDEDPDATAWLERQIIMNAHDQLWQEHLYIMDNLQEEIYLMGHAQRDPLVEFKRESFHLFNDLINRINNEICHSLFRSATSLTQIHNMLHSLPMQEVHNIFGQFDAGPPTETAGPADGEDEEPKKLAPIRRESPKVGRNSPCPCGSGKKFKQCCGR